VLEKETFPPPLAFKGLLTGTITAMLETNEFLYSAFYYDYRGRTIQAKSTNHLGGLEKEYIQYDFTGNPLKRLHIHTIPKKDPITEEYTYEYDHAGRLKTTKHKLNNASAKTIANNKYDEIGRLDKASNSTTGAVSYDYDVHSRLKSIDANEFAQGLDYTFGGNIKTMEWRNNAGQDYEHGYNFTYDKISRLKEANYFNANNNDLVNGSTYYHYSADGVKRKVVLSLDRRNC